MPSNNNENANKGSALKSKLIGFFTKNLAIKILSLFFAVLLWGYIIMSENPDREKQVNHVSVSFEGEADLIARRLVVRGDRQEILQDVNVKVKTKLDKYADLDANDITATINLKNVSLANIYTLQIYATAANGTVVSTTPSQVIVEIDDLVTRVIPLEVVFEGTLPEGYWAGEPVIGRSELTIEGPATDLESIVKGVCRVNLTNRTASFNESIQVELVDMAGNTMDASVLLGQLPSVSVKLEILKSVEVSVDIASAVLGAENLPANYEVADIRTTPSTVSVAGLEAVLDALGSLAVESVDISGRTESLLTELAIDAPEGVKLLDGDSVEVYIDIREKTEQLILRSMPIGIKNLGRKMDAALASQEADVVIRGRVSLIKKLQRDDVKLYVDLSGLSAGEYDLDIQLELPNNDDRSELTWELTPPSVRVKLEG